MITVRELLDIVQQNPDALPFVGVWEEHDRCPDIAAGIDLFRVEDIVTVKIDDLRLPVAFRIDVVHALVGLTGLFHRVPVIQRPSVASGQLPAPQTRFSVSFRRLNCLLDHRDRFLVALRDQQLALILVTLFILLKQMRIGQTAFAGLHLCLGHEFRYILLSHYFFLLICTFSLLICKIRFRRVECFSLV